MSFIYPTGVIPQLKELQERLDAEIQRIKNSLEGVGDTSSLEDRIHIVEQLQALIVQQVSNIYHSFYNGGSDS